MRKSRDFSEIQYIFFFLLGLLHKAYPTEVITVRFYGTQASGYAVCPSCDSAIGREYQNCCDRCGQKLGWKLFSQGKVSSQRIHPVREKIRPTPKQEEKVLSCSS